MRAVDWIGLDAYPGTVFPPVEAPGGDRDGMVNAMSSLRCFARIPGIPASVPMKVEENGWPTFPGRSEAMQAEVLRAMVGAVHDFRGTYNVTDYRWFNLRDGDTAAPSPSSTSACSTAPTGRSPRSPCTPSWWGACTASSRPRPPRAARGRG